MQHIDSDLIRGNIDTIILKTMLKEDKYGLDIIKEVGEKSSGTYELKQPTLYSCLKRLENQELISSYWVDSDIGGRRHYYKLTDKGRDFYAKKQEEWAKSKFIIDNLLSNYDYEEYRLVKKDEFDEMLQKKANAPLSSFESSTENGESITDEDINNSVITAPEASDDYEELDTESGDEKDSDIPEKYKIEIVEDDDEEYGSYYRQQQSTYTYNEEDDESDDEEEAEDDSDSQIDSSSDFDEFSEDEEFSNIETIEDLEIYLQNTSSSSDDSEDDDDVFALGENNSETLDNENFEENIISESDSDDNDYPVYFSANRPETTYSETNTVSYETTDQSSNELNILSRLRGQEDEEINTYVGDQKSYVNHLNQIDEDKLEQQDLLDSSLYVKPDLVNKSIDDFTDAIEKLNNFGSESTSFVEKQTEDDSTQSLNEEFEEEINENPIENSYIEPEIINEEIDDLEELNKLKNLSSNAFFYSNDKTEYIDIQNNQNISTSSYETLDEYEPEYYDFDETAHHQSFAEISSEIEPRHDEYAIETVTNTETDAFENDYEDYESDNHFNDIDTIISNNVTATYPEPTQHFYKTQSVNYREKLSDLSKYSNVSLEEEKSSVINEDAIEKAKDIAEITKELEEEGIKIKEHYKSSNLKSLDKNYLLSNKINLIRSLIMLFGYVFVLSALYIVLNNTEMKECSWFSIKPFLLGFIPFGIIFIYNAILFAINPYKKIDAKYHSRIMLFISIIITIQLLLITYCVNLQLGFYSFSQKGYNHLLWIVPTIISFAPIIDNLVYLALFKSKNFNV